MELKSKISDLRTFYELRKSHSHVLRKAQARVFIFENQLGISDASGVLWPIYFDHETDSKLSTGDMISFEGNFIQREEASNGKKYSDHSFGLFISKVTNIIPCLEEWKNPFVESPLSFNFTQNFFANENEILALCKTSSLDSALDSIQSVCEIVIVTLSEKGSIILTPSARIHIPAERVLNVVDSTGAGDFYAAGFLFGLTQKHSLEMCGNLASLCGAHVIQYLGARPDESLVSLIA